MNDRSPAEEIFFAALERGTPAGRAAYLAEACAGDEALRRRIPRDAGPAAPGGRPGTPRTAAEVFAEFGPRIRRLAWRMLGNEADADDVAQDVLLLVVRKLHTYRGESSFATWVHRVTANAALLHRRKRALIRERGAPEVLAGCADDHRAAPARREAAAPDEQAQGREERELIEGAIARLPQLYREAYVLGEVEGLPNAEIGARLGLSVPAVKSRLHRAKLLLRRALAPHFGAVGAEPAC